MNPIWIIAGVAALGVIAIIVVNAMRKSQEHSFRDEAESRMSRNVDTVTAPNATYTDDASDSDTKMPDTIGTPIFNDNTGPTGRRNPCSILSSASEVWVVGPSGPIKVRPSEVHKSSATLENNEYIVKAVLKDNYFSQTVADKLGIPRGAWCLNDIRLKSKQHQWYRNSGSSIRFSRQVGDTNRAWLGEYSLFADFFDITLGFMYMMMDEFYYEFDHYQDEYPMQDEIVEKIGEENFNEEPSVVDAQETQMLEMNEQIDVTAEAPEPEPEPERYEAPPAYEAPSTYEAPSSYDSGGDDYGDDGGGDFGD